MANLPNRYFRYVCSLVADGDNYESYSNLLRHLAKRDFTWIFGRDEDRAKDGIELRVQYEYETGFSANCNSVCSVLEMLVALAIRSARTITITDDKLQMRLFWLMIVDMGLLPFNNSQFRKANVDDILDRFLERRYKEDGEGSIFILKNHGDIRKTEFWQQAMWYLAEAVE